ncbi:hypothetical protein DE146DRAFT_696543 [Phaeosphaeria sp. MPI-PUGE-AT-0046c]|nr:hypothetical protein DE146DRAFT_696543 [Phaeosphaeria sp. MPI-PUGE-AT-0046c]
MASERPFIVIVPGGAHNPAHYGYLSHLLQLAGYPVFSALLPSVGATGNVTIEEDAEYIRERMILPILDIAEHDVIILMHSYAGAPGSAALKGLSKTERSAAGKKTSVIGQIFFTAFLTKGDDGLTALDIFGGQFPPYIYPDQERNIVLCDDPIPPLYQDVAPTLADAAAVSGISQCLTSFKSPCPRATWDSDGFKGRIAYIRTLNDACVPLVAQQMMIDTSGVDLIVKDIESGHSPQLSHPEEFTSIIVELAQTFEKL